MSELESVQRDRDGRVVAVTVEGRTLHHLPLIVEDLFAARETVDDLTRSMSDLAADLLIEGERADKAAAELASARRVAQAVDWLRERRGCLGAADHDYASFVRDTDTFLGLCAAAVGGPGPTPEPATGQYDPVPCGCRQSPFCPHGDAVEDRAQPFGPGPTDDEQGDNR